MIQSILIVDDDPAVLQLLKEMLQSAGYESRCFHEAQDAIDAVQHEKFDLAIIDLKLGKKNGLEVMKSIHGIDADIPVIILTGYGTVESAVEAMDMGAFNYLTKPINNEKLLFQVKWSLEKSRLHSEIKKLKEVASTGGILDMIYSKDSTGVQLRPYHEACDEFASQYLIHVIDISGGDISKAARIAELSEDDFSQLLKKHCIGIKDIHE